MENIPENLKKASPNKITYVIGLFVIVLVCGISFYAGMYTQSTLSKSAYVIPTIQVQKSGSPTPTLLPFPQEPTPYTLKQYDNKLYYSIKIPNSWAPQPCAFEPSFLSMDFQDEPTAEKTCDNGKIKTYMSISISEYTTIPPELGPPGNIDNWHKSPEEEITINDKKFRRIIMTNLKKDPHSLDPQYSYWNLYHLIDIPNERVYTITAFTEGKPTYIEEILSTLTIR